MDSALVPMILEYLFEDETENDLLVPSVSGFTYFSTTIHFTHV